MPADKPEWLSVALDVAQIVSAVATAMAVIVAIWLARRGESQRLRFFVGNREVVSIADGRAETQSFLSLTVVNAGMFPVKIINGSFSLQQTGGRWSASLESYEREHRFPLFPLTLAHGEAVIFDFPIEPTANFWRNLHWAWRFWTRPYFRVITSLGKSYTRKVDLRILREISELFRS